VDPETLARRRLTKTSREWHLSEAPVHGVPIGSARPRSCIMWLSAFTHGGETLPVRPSPPRAAWPLKLVALLGDVPVAAAPLRHLGGLLPPAFGVAFHPHVREPLRASFAAPHPTSGTALWSSSASAHSAFLLVALPPYSTLRKRSANAPEDKKPTGRVARREGHLRSRLSYSPALRRRASKSLTWTRRPFSSTAPPSCRCAKALVTASLLEPIMEESCLWV
jgi:hypothetical protein